MPRYTGKGVISFYQFQVGAADAGQPNLNQGLSLNRLGLRHILAKAQDLVFQSDSMHVLVPLSSNNVLTIYSEIGAF